MSIPKKENKREKSTQADSTSSAASAAPTWPSRNCEGSCWSPSTAARGGHYTTSPCTATREHRQRRYNIEVTANRSTKGKREVTELLTAGYSQPAPNERLPFRHGLPRSTTALAEERAFGASTTQLKGDRHAKLPPAVRLRMCGLSKRGKRRRDSARGGRDPAVEAKVL